MDERWLLFVNKTKAALFDLFNSKDQANLLLLHHFTWVLNDNQQVIIIYHDDVTS
jgi:hypothetical protein